MLFHLSRHFQVLHNCLGHGAHEVYRILAHWQSWLTIHHEEASDWYSTLGDHRHTSIEPEMWGPSNKRQCVEAVILGKVVDDEARVVSRLGWLDLDSPAWVSRGLALKVAVLPLAKPASLGHTAAAHPYVIARRMFCIVYQVHRLCALCNEVLGLGINHTAGLAWH